MESVAFFTRRKSDGGRETGYEDLVARRVDIGLVLEVYSREADLAPAESVTLEHRYEVNAR